jgi:Choline dehydrogenase and related flavoproteins
MTDTFDFVVVGGGSGGCAVASRLSEDPNTSVALLEAGGECNNWVVTSPGAMILQIAGKVNNWAFDTVPQAGPQRPDRLSAARQGARRFLRDQCDGLYPRPSQRLRSVGVAWQHRLVLCRRAALLQAFGG